MSFWSSVIFGLVFGLFAGAMAFIIVRREYVHHKMAPARLLLECLSAAALAFAFFFLAALAVGAVLPHIL